MRGDSTYHSLTADDGFTLPELMTSLAIMLIVIAALWAASNAITFMTDKLLALSDANTRGSGAVEAMAGEIREGIRPPADELFPFRTKTATQVSFYMKDGGSRYKVVTYQSVANGSTYKITRSTASTTTNVAASSVTSLTTFTQVGTPSIVASGVTNPNIFTYYLQHVTAGKLTNAATVTTTTPPVSVRMQVVTSARVGKSSAVATNAVLTQVRTLYDYKD